MAKASQSGVSDLVSGKLKERAYKVVKGGGAERGRGCVFQPTQPVNSQEVSMQNTLRDKFTSDPEPTRC